MTSTDKVMFRAKRAKPRYLAAIARRQETQPDLTEADWYREACDRLAARDLRPGGSSGKGHAVSRK